MALLLQPTFFAPIIHYVAIARNSDVLYEKQDNYQKQTYRNRCYIYGANGKHLLTVPIVHSASGARQKTKDVKIDSSFSWKKIFIKSLESSYRSSPYFEYYEDDILKVFEKKHTFLLDFQEGVKMWNQVKDLMVGACDLHIHAGPDITPPV